MSKAVVGFIDMDCFYVAVERQRDPRLNGRPCAVVQYNSRQRGGAPDLPCTANRWVQGGSASGGIIAVSYEARSRGVTRQMNSQEARKHCPEIVLVQVPTAFGKADLKIYKDAGDSVVSLLARRAGACEKRSVDEVAIDITAEAERLLRERDWATDLLPGAQRASHLADSAQSRSATTFSRDETRLGHAGQQVREAEAETLAAGWAQSSTWGSAEQRLVAGAVVVEELRAAIAQELGFTCSGGVAENKILAKLGCGLHKPNQQTIVLPGAVAALLHDLPLDRLPGLGGDLGAQVKEELQVSTASELAAVPRERLEAAFPRQATFLLELAEGRRHEPVQDRELLKSLSNGKTFPGHLRLNTAAQCERWLNELARELHQRYLHDVARNSRAPTRISVSVGTSAGSSSHASRQGPINLGPAGSPQQIAGAACECFRRWMALGAPSDGALGVVSLGLSLSGMQPVSTGKRILNFFKAPPVAAAPAPAIAAAVPAAAAPAPSEGELGNEAVGGGCLIDLDSPERSVPNRAKDSDVQLIEDGESEPAEPRKHRSLDCFERFRRLAAPQPSGPQSGPVLSSGPHSAAGAELSEVDPSVLAELPPEIQAEIREQLRLTAGAAVAAQVPAAVVPAAPPAALPTAPPAAPPAVHATPAAPAAPATKRRKVGGGGGGLDAFFRPGPRGAAGG